MAYMKKRRFNRRRNKRFSRRRTRRSRGGSFKKKVRTIIKGMAEKKYFTFQNTDVAITNTPYYLPIMTNSWIPNGYSPATQGTNQSQRVGNSILLKGIRFEALLSSESESVFFTDDWYNQVRLSMGFNPSYTQGSFTSFQWDVDTIRRFDTQKYGTRFRWDKKYLLKTPFEKNDDSLAPAFIRIDKYIKLNKTINFYSNTAVSSTLEPFFMWVSDSSTIPHPTFIKIRITGYYTDV